MEEFLKENGEALQYVAFFGGMVLFGLLEVVNPVDRRSPNRLQRWRTNYAVTVIGILFLGLLPLTSFAAAVWARSNNVGLLNRIEVDLWVVILTTLAARSLVSWVVHFASHKIHFLWRFHRVHHMDTRLDVSTTFRLHPLESLVGFLAVIPTVVLLGLSPWVLILYEVLDAGVTVFTHSNIKLPRWLDRIIRLALVTPDMHRIHHSAWQPETDSNYGAVFSIWDRVFRSYRSEARDEPGQMQLGLDVPRDKRTNSFFWLLFSPFFRL